MYPSSFEAFDEIVFCDTEFDQTPGNRPQPICLVLYEQRAKRVTRFWLWRRAVPPEPPILQSKCILFVAYLATAEFSVFKALHWSFPKYVLDLNVEMRNLTNGIRPTTFISLVESAQIFHIPYINKERKDEMRDIAITGGPLVDMHKAEILSYCEDDTRVMEPILEEVKLYLSLPHALIRGEYVKASAEIEYHGLPINVPMYKHILAYREP
jgi:hypothetical protein